MLYVARIIVKGLACVRQQRDQPEVRKIYCALEFVFVIEAAKLVSESIEIESRYVLHSISMISSMCTHCVDDLLPHTPLHWQLLGIWSSVYYNHKHMEHNLCACTCTEGLFMSILRILVSTTIVLLRHFSIYDQSRCLFY